MRRIVLLAIMGFITLGGWALAQQQELRDNLGDTHMQLMQDASCTPSSNPSGGG